MSAAPEFSSYYGRPILKAHVWKPEVPLYFFAGGLAGVSGALALGARIAGNEALARNATFAALGGAAVSPALLISDLGRPERFYNMLRVVKITSPMSIGSWVLAAAGTASGVAAGCEALGIAPRTKLAAQVAGGLFGLPLATYTGALLANTAVPVWHEARRELPFVFAGGAAASAGAVAALTTPAEQARPARRLAVAGAVLELAAARAMHLRLGDLVGEPYHQGTAGQLSRLATSCTAAGALLLLEGRRRALGRAGSALLLAGSLLERWAVFKAGTQSAADPKYTVVPQRQRAGRNGTRVTTFPSASVRG